MPAGDDGRDTATASEATDVTEKVGTAFLTEEGTEDEAAIETGKASDSGSDFDYSSSQQSHQSLVYSSSQPRSRQ